MDERLPANVLLPLRGMQMFNKFNQPWYREQPLVAVRRIFQFLGTPRHNVICKQPWGTTLEVNPNEAVGRAIWNTGITDMVVCEAICRLLRPGDTAFDVGTNLGFMSSVMAASVGRQGKVVCFEPNPHVLPLLRRNLRRMEEAGMVIPTLCECAVAERSGKMRLVCPTAGDGNDGIAHLAGNDCDGVDVTVVTLDDVYDDGHPIRLIKIDVEGFEAAVLKGATRLLADKQIEFIVFEEHRDAGDAESFVVLQDHGYEVLRLGWDPDRPLYAALSDPPIHSRYEPANYIAICDRPAFERAYAKPGFTVFNQQHWRSLRSLAR